MLTNGKRLDGRYIIREQIGGGGFGAVFLAEDTRFSGKNLVAVKQILQNDPQLTRSFRREADLLYNLNHPNLPKVTNCFQEDGSNFIVMDYISGEDLAQRLKRGKRFSVAEALNTADKVLDALEYLHSATIFHRDIKPHNIKIDETGKIYLLDFGTAKGTFDESTITQNPGQSITGFTPFYAPLEQVLRVDPNSFLLLKSIDSPLLGQFIEKRTDERSDIYSLGATLYHLLTGISPEKATSTFRAFSVWSGKNDPLQNMREFNSEVSAQLADIVYKSLELDPENRFQTAAEFRNAIKNMRRERPTVIAGDFSTEKTLAFNTAESIAETQPSHTQIDPLKKNDSPPSFEPLPQTGARPENASKLKALYRIPVIIPAILLLAVIGLGSWAMLRDTTKNTPASPVATVPPRALSYSLLVQKMRAGKEYQEPFESSGQEIFESGYKFVMRFTPPDDGFVYIFAEGLDEKGEKVFNIAFPTPKQNEGKPDVLGGLSYRTGWNEFDGGVGTENFWVIWSREQPEIAEKSRENSSQNKGRLTDKALENGLKSYLEKNKNDKVSVSKGAERKQTTIQFGGDAIAYLIQLEHR